MAMIMITTKLNIYIEFFFQVQKENSNQKSKWTTNVGSIGLKPETIDEPNKRERESENFLRNE